MYFQSIEFVTWGFNQLWLFTFYNKEIKNIVDLMFSLGSIFNWSNLLDCVIVISEPLTYHFQETSTNEEAGSEAIKCDVVHINTFTNV